MIIISLLHLSLFLGVSSRRHIFTASFSFVTCKRQTKNSTSGTWIAWKAAPLHDESMNLVHLNIMSLECYSVMTPDSHGVGRSKHGQSHPCPASLWTPSPHSSGSAWREVSPWSNRNLRESIAIAIRKQGLADEFNHDKLLVPTEKPALIDKGSV